MQRAVQSLEAEYEELTGQYRRLLLALQRDTLAVRESGGEEATCGASLRLSEELVEVVQRLQAKGDQLRAVKYGAPQV